MTSQTPKALFIGPANVGDALAKMRKDWKFLPSVNNIPEFYGGLTSHTIDTDIDVLFVIDKFFDQTGERRDLEQLIAALAGQCLVMIVNYDEDNREQINERVMQEVYSIGMDSDIYYYFVRPKPKGTPQKDIEAAVRNYTIRDKSDPAIVARLLGREYVPNTEERDDMIASDPIIAVDDEESPYFGQIIAVTSSKGGSGKSSVAVLTAAYLARASRDSYQEGIEDRELKVVVVDFDVKDGQLGFLTNKYKPNVTRAVSKPVIDEAAVKEAIITDKRLGCDLILAPRRPRYAEEIPNESFIELLVTLKKMYDFIILDTSVQYTDELIEKVAYPASDKIIFVTDIVINSMYSMVRWIQEVTGARNKGFMGIPKNKIAIVVNKAMKGVNMEGDKVNKCTQGLPVLSTIPANPRVMATAANYNSMDLALEYPAIAKSIFFIAYGIVGDKYKLSNTILKKKDESKE